MEVKGLSWLGMHTDRYPEMVSFLKESLGLESDEEDSDFVSFPLPDGSKVEVFGPGETEHAFFTNPVVGFAVDSVERGRVELEAAGIEFIGPIHGREDASWSHFRAPDGYIYELAGPR